MSIVDPITIQPGAVRITAQQQTSSYYLFRMHEFSPLLFKWPGLYLDPNVTKLIILIHGWNTSQDNDYYSQDSNFNNLGTAINNQVSGTEWKLIGYHWEADADTGPIIPLDLAPLNGAKAAEASYLHGLNLGQVILNNYPHVQQVQFIAHSAGAWCARTAAKYLMQRGSGIKTEVTLLDPFVPGSLTSLELPNPSSLTDGLINELLTVGTGLYVAENYYSNDPLLPGTQDTFWNGASIGWGLSGINEQVGSSTLDPMALTDRFGGHSGPILFYTETVGNTVAGFPTMSPNLATFGTDVQQIGWWRSMFINEPLIA